MSTHEHPGDEPTTEQTTEQTTGQRGETPTPRRTGWHQVNTGHLVMGVAFVGLVVVWALLTSGTVAIEHHGWVMGLPWLAAGAIGLAATVLRGPRRHWHHDVWHHDAWGHGGWSRGKGGEGDNRGSGSMHGWH